MRPALCRGDAFVSQVRQKRMPRVTIRKHLHVDLGLSQTEFGALLGVNYNQVSIWENGHKKPPIYKQRLIEGMAQAVEHGGVIRLASTLSLYGPAFALWFVLDRAYR